MAPLVVPCFLLYMYVSVYPAYQFMGITRPAGFSHTEASLTGWRRSSSSVGLYLTVLPSFSRQWLVELRSQYILSSEVKLSLLVFVRHVLLGTWRALCPGSRVWEFSPFTPRTASTVRESGARWWKRSHIVHILTINKRTLWPEIWVSFLPQTLTQTLALANVLLKLIYY